MKKNGTINAPISRVISMMGHTDMITIADAGLPIPGSVERIDLALKRNVPKFIDTLSVVLDDLHIEKAIVADELLTVSPIMYDEIRKIIPEEMLETIPHVEFKQKTAESKAVIRTGEFTPYANVILVAGAWGFELDKD
jgi:D-ribose pyranase